MVLGFKLKRMATNMKVVGKIIFTMVKAYSAFLMVLKLREYGNLKIRLENILLHFPVAKNKK